MWPAGWNEGTLHKAFQSLLADRVFSFCDNMFTQARLHDVTFTTEMTHAFESAKKPFTDKERLETEAELKATEEKAARLRQRLGK
jgi:hypothetical protein